MPFLFSLDKRNYAKWLSIHLNDLHSLRITNLPLFEQIAKFFTVKKSNKPFSRIAVDHAHEMNNATVKGCLNVISLWDSPGTLNRWTLSSSLIKEMLCTFESGKKYYESDEQSHHSDDTTSKNYTIIKDIKSMMSTFEELGNPFGTDSRLFNLETGNIVDKLIEEDIKKIEKLGLSQYRDFVSERIENNLKGFKSPMKANKLKLMTFKPKKSNVSSKLKSLKEDYGTFSRLMLACQNRKSDLTDFFEHENHAFPPSLSSDGKIRIASNKSELAPCLLKDMANPVTIVCPSSTCVIFDGAFIAQGTYPRSAMTFAEYALEFERSISTLAKDATRVDVVFDRYINPSIKSAARLKRGEGGEKRVKEEISVPKGRDTWKKFLLNQNNKSELYRLLARSLTSNHHTHKHIIATFDESILTTSRSENTNLDDLSMCNHEEADTRIFLHAKNAANNGHISITIRSSDTDVLVIAVHHFEELKIEQFWIATGTGKDFRYLPVHEIFNYLEPSRAASLPFFHAFTGCDTVSSFF